MSAHSRRDLLRGILVAAGVSGAGLLAACTGPAEPDGSTAIPGPTDTTGPSPEEADAAVRTAAVAGERDLIAAYDSAIAAYPELAATLGLIRDQHIAHAEALGAAPTSPSAASGGAPAPGGTSPVVALESLAQSERAAAEARTRECAEATGPDTVRLLALIAASESSHAEALAGAALAVAP